MTLLRLTSVITLSLFVFCSCDKSNPLVEPTSHVEFIVQPSVALLDTTSVLISWDTTARTAHTLSYWRQSARVNRVTSDSSQTHHEVLLSHLAPGAEYTFIAHCYVASQDSISSEETSFLVPGASWHSAGVLRLSNGAFAASRAAFRNELSHDPDYGPAWMGLGWAFLLDDSLQVAEEVFNHALDTPTCALDDPALTHAGLAIAHIARSEFASALSSARAALLANPMLELPAIPTINHLDVQLVLAEAAYHQAMLPEALSALRIILPELGVVEEDPSTWIVGGHAYSTLSAVVVAALDLAALRCSD